MPVFLQIDWDLGPCNWQRKSEGLAQRSAAAFPAHIICHIQPSPRGKGTVMRDTINQIAKRLIASKFALTMVVSPAVLDSSLLAGKAFAKDGSSGGGSSGSGSSGSGSSGSGSSGGGSSGSGSSGSGSSGSGSGSSGSARS